MGINPDLGTWFKLNDYEYGVCVLSAVLIGMHCVIVGFAVTGGRRKEYFNQKFMTDNFGGMHLEATGQDIKPFGYPDTGSGIYSHKLPYGQWLDFNKAQRVHLNYLEVVFQICLFTLIGGLYQPIPAAVFGFIFLLGRIGYGFYTSPKGAQHPLRMAGALLSDIGIFANFILAFLTCLKWMGAY